MKNNLLFIDAETDGLYGSFLTVAIIVINKAGEEIDRAYYGIKKEAMVIQNSWVRENVLPVLGDYKVCEDETELLEKVWVYWRKYKDNSYAIADVAYPVEYRLFEKCVKENLPKKQWEAPYPLLDLSSMLYAKGIDPLENRAKLVDLESDNKQHNALLDVEISIALWKKYVRGD